MNRMGIGAGVRLYRPGRLGDPAALLGYREIGTGFGFCSGQEAVAHFGLGDVARCDLEVVLPGGRGTVRKRDIAADQRVVITER